MARWVQEHRPETHWLCPQLPASPRETLALLRDLVAGWPRERMAVMGSSLGGFYATVLAEVLGCPAVLLNPAINPARDLSRHVGEHALWHEPNEHFYFAPEFVDELSAMECHALTDPQRYFAVIAKGDEVLDWREMLSRYQQGQVLLLDGSDHGLSDFDQHLPQIIDFLQWNP